MDSDDEKNTETGKEIKVKVGSQRVFILACLGINVRLQDTYYFVVFVLLCLQILRFHSVCPLIFHCVYQKSGVLQFQFTLLEVMFLPAPKEGSRVSCCETITASSQLCCCSCCTLLKHILLMLFHWD